MYHKAMTLFPGGVNSPVRYYPPYPIYIKRGRGPYVYDADGRKYVDFLLAFGPMVLGHSHPSVVRKIKERAEEGTLFGAPIEEEIEFGEILKKSSGIEKMRIVSSGSEATLHALRLSLFHTKRKKILKIRGGYHGTHVFNYSSLIVDEVNFNSVEEAKAKLKSRDYAALIMEPIMGNAGVILPEDGYLQEMCDLSHRYGSIFIMDEVITGYRTAFSPYYKKEKIDPDLTTFAKIIGGGLPLAVYGGNEDIMKNVRPQGIFPQAGTYSANPLSVVGGLETLKILSRKDYSKLDRLTKIATDELRKSGLTVNHITGMLSFFFTNKPVKNYDGLLKSNTKLFQELFNKMLSSGIYLPPAFDETIFISFAHNEKQIKNSFSIMAEEIERIWKKS